MLTKLLNIQYLQLYLLLQCYYRWLLILAGCVVEHHHCTTPTNIHHDHQVIYRDLHHLKLNLLPRFLFKIIVLKNKYMLITIRNIQTAVSLTRLLYFNFKIAFILNNRRSTQNTSTTTYPGTIFHNYYFITCKN